jgi:flagellar hook-length control protein FliK
VKAAAPQALLSPQVKAGGRSRSAPGQAARPRGTPADAFFRILSARLGLKDGRTTRAQAPAGQAGQPTPPSQAAEAAPAKAAPEPGNQKDAAAAARRRAARVRGMAADGALDIGAGAAGPVGEQASGRPARKADAARAEAAAAVSRRSAEPRVFVLDLRRNADTAGAEAKAAAPAAQAGAQGRDPDGPLAGLSFGARSAGARDSASSARGARPGAAAAGPFETALERLRGMAGSEMVRASGIILRDGGGEIRLVLKPESLGSVRIRMNVVDNGIEGRIIVDNAAVKQVLDGSLDALAKALTAQGFQNATLEVAVGGQNADGGRAAQEPHPGLRRESAERFEGNVPGVESVSLGDLLVNLFV